MQAVKMYTTQVCPYCQRAKMLLKQRGVEAIEEVRIDLDPAQRDQMMSLTGRRTVPQIFIGETRRHGPWRVGTRLFGGCAATSW